jgi:hypothetical protein
MRTVDSRLNLDPLSGHQNNSDAGADQAKAWEMIEAGRYQPKRIRGSFPGRELG